MSQRKGRVETAAGHSFASDWLEASCEIPERLQRGWRLRGAHDGRRMYDGGHPAEQHQNGGTGESVHVCLREGEEEGTYCAGHGNKLALGWYAPESNDQPIQRALASDAEQCHGRHADWVLPP